MFVTNSLSGGGAERSMNILVNELHSRNLDVLLVPINSGPRDQVVPRCRVIELNRNWKSGIIETLKSFVKFQKLVFREKPSIIVLNCDLPEMFGALLVFSSKQLVVVEHSSFPWKTRSKLGRIVRRILLIKSSNWVCVSDHLRIWPFKLLPDAVIPNPLYLTQLKSTSRPNGKISRLVFIGRLSLEKGPNTFLEICSATNLPGLMIGEGRMRSELESHVKEKGLNVNFAGQQLYPWELINRNDLIIIPSEYEGDGLVLLEAMARNHSMLVNDIPDFRRFNLLEVNYCRSPKEYRDRILTNLGNIQSLSIPEGISKELLRSRAVDSVGDEWVDFLCEAREK